MAKIKRSQIATYINTTPEATATYELLGVGIVNAKIDYNPKNTEETYIHEDSATISVDSYAPTMGIEATAVAGNAAFAYLDTIRKARSVLGDCETDIVNVWLYETPVSDSYPAEKQNVAIQIDDFGGEGGQAAKINFTLNFQGAPVDGDYDIVLDTFTPTT